MYTKKSLVSSTLQDIADKFSFVWYNNNCLVIKAAPNNVQHKSNVRKRIINKSVVLSY